MVRLIGESLWQWDKGRKVVIALPKGHTVHKVEFSNNGRTDAIEVKFNKENEKVYASIPNILLQESKMIVCYVVCSTDDSEFTKEYWTFKVIERHKPADYIYTEEEVKNYSNIENRVLSLENKVDNLTQLLQSINN